MFKKYKNVLILTRQKIMQIKIRKKKREEQNKHIIEYIIV